MAFGYDRFMRASERACLEAWRRELLAEVSGDVLEIGAGTGANLPFYPRARSGAASPSRLVLTESDRFMLAKLEARAEGARKEGEEGALPIELVCASGDALPFPDASFDTVVSTLVLCTVPDVAATLGEVKRVLKAGGRLVFLEHVAADQDASRFRWQRRLEPIWKVFADGCHLTRRTGESIREAGFVIESEKRECMRRALPIIRPTVRGVAIAR